jgi:peptidoglycan hydrolase CwlO-like protein
MLEWVDNIKLHKPSEGFKMNRNIIILSAVITLISIMGFSSMDAQDSYTLSKKISDQEDEISHLKTSILSLESNVSSLEMKQREYDEKIEKLESDNSSLESDVSSLQSEVSNIPN